MKQLPITSQQLRALHVVFTQKGFSKEDRCDFIQNYTEGRTESSKELTLEEARNILAYFMDDKKGDNQEQARGIVGSIYKLSLQISCLNKGYGSEREEERRMNYAKINHFCKERTEFRKPLTGMSLEELKKVKKQFEALKGKERV
ncbi:hypothetical protein EZS27_012345 [termite gut metagenome]|uniref:Uncharacterized protein n=1 Tax=termite gut metagenome TaxID=433724 RepID=A0A5J4S0R4_9ZZZZ